MSLPVIAIFDVGKTNKKLLLFDEQYKLVHEESKVFEETKDEDGFPCEDVLALTKWINDSFERLLHDERFDVKAVNFSAYGASFVYLDDAFNIFLPLYNYLKPYPAPLQKQFYDQYGGESLIARQTASPVLGNLNSGMQLYRLKYEKPEAFALIKYALHLPQYLSYILSGKTCSDITSIGCHTNLWDFQNNKYHSWVNQEGIDGKLPAISDSEAIAGYADKSISVGVGLHDSSAALIPFLSSFHEPFILISTGTWCISLNPFNHAQLSDYELHQDCLCYLTYTGKPVKASRLFAGYEHGQQTKKLAAHFNKPADYFTGVYYDMEMLSGLKYFKNKQADTSDGAMVNQSYFATRDLSDFTSFEQAYHQLIADIIEQQLRSTKLVWGDTPIKKIFVDGGFSRNDIYMNLLAKAFRDIEVYAASIAQASALGAALAIHKHWNKRPLLSDLVELRLYAVGS